MEQNGNLKLYSSINHNEYLKPSSSIKKITTNIVIPAYDAHKNGLTIEIKIKAAKQSFISIDSRGPIAITLEQNFRRIISIMTSINKQWECLNYYSYQLRCSSNNFKVSDARSSSLALSLALLNIYRDINGSHQVNNITGTGMLRIDGSFEETYLEQQKYFAVKNMGKVKKEFITSGKCQHLLDLENLLNQF